MPCSPHTLRHPRLLRPTRVERPRNCGKRAINGMWSNHHTTSHRPSSAFVTQFPYFTHTVLIFVNSLIPLLDNSRLCPERFAPPKETRGSDATIWLMNAIPASSSLLKRSRSAGSLVQAL